MRSLSYPKKGVRLGAILAPCLFAISGLLATTNLIAPSDTTHILSHMSSANDRWRMHISATPSGSIHNAQMAFTDPILTGSIAPAASIDLGNGEQVSLDAQIGAAKIGQPEGTPDEARVTRHLKKGRVMSVVPSQPPKNFSAGSIVGEQSALDIPASQNQMAMVFGQSEFSGKELEIASAFYPHKQEPAKPTDVPDYLIDLITNNHADILATAYAPPPVDYAKQSPFASILNEDPDHGRFKPPIEKGDHDWADDPLPATAFSEDEQRCLAAGIYFEARGEKLEGQAAVAQVILNRVRNPAYPRTVCGVVYQNKHWRNRCQFSFACDGIRDRVKSPKHWDIAEEVALATTAGKIWLKEVGSSTHYHATYVRPKWAKSMRRVGRIGLHIFYVTYGGGWS